MVRKLVVSLIAAGWLAASAYASASAPMPSTEAGSAELAFADPGSPGGLAGTFSAIDGERLADVTAGAPIRVPAGEHTIEYSCPDRIAMGQWPTVRATFVAGRRYALDCAADSPAVVREVR